ncbi:MAG: DUF2092 domain-containing protein, partial [Candidatus Binatia bacterium]
MKSRNRVLLWASLALAAGLAAPALADEETAANEAAPSEGSVQARQLLDAMAGHLSATDAFSVELLASYEVVQEDGRKLEFAEKRDVAVSRPDKVRIDSEHSDGSEGVTLFDGKQITLYDASTNVYVTAPQKAGIDETVVHFVRDLRMRLPLAPLVMKTLPQELARRVESVDYVEKTGIYGDPLHHIAGRTATVDFEMWIADGKKPLLKKIALTYREAEGQPRFEAEFSDWDLDPGFRKSKFVFDAPKGAKPLPFAAE